MNVHYAAHQDPDSAAATFVLECVPQTNPSTGNVEDVVLSSRAICCSVAKQLQVEWTPTPFQSETQMVGDIGKPIKLAPTNDSICDSIAVER